MFFYASCIKTILSETKQSFRSKNDGIEYSALSGIASIVLHMEIGCRSTYVEKKFSG